MYNRNFVFLIILIGSLYFGNNAIARFATYEDSVSEYEISNQYIIINKDGTSEEINEIKIKILKESARELAARFPIIYNENTTQVKILDAKTIYEGKEYKVLSDFIEDKPLPSNAQGFDKIRRKLIVFPKVEVGSRIYLKYKIKHKHAPIKNNYAWNFYIGEGGWWKANNIKIKSAIPLKILVNDPYNTLKVIKGNGDAIKEIEIQLIKPFTNDLIDDIKEGSLNERLYTWVSVSSLKDWSDISNSFSKRYYDVINQPLPKIFETIATEAKEKGNEIEQINAVTSLLNTKIQYLGDWRSVSGTYIPRNLNTIASTQFGDCKDFSVSTAAILKSLGYKAQVIMVKRGEIISDYVQLPNGAAFNHAMLKVTGKNGNIYWIDPTNIVSMAGGIFPDIADRIALVLDVKEPKYERIPSANIIQSVVSANRELQIMENGLIDNTYEVDLIGSSAKGITGIGLFYSKKSIEDMVYRVIGKDDIDDMDRKEAVIPPLADRVVKDIKFKLRYQSAKETLKTNLGNAVKLTYKMQQAIRDIKDNDIGDFYMGVPERLSRNLTIKGKRIKNIEGLNILLETPWIKLSRKCVIDGDDTKIIDDMETLKSYITNDERKSKEFLQLKKFLQENYNDIALVY